MTISLRLCKMLVELWEYSFHNRKIKVFCLQMLHVCITLLRLLCSYSCIYTLYTRCCFELVPCPYIRSITVLDKCLVCALIHVHGLRKVMMNNLWHISTMKCGTRKFHSPLRRLRHSVDYVYVSFHTPPPQEVHVEVKTSQVMAAQSLFSISSAVLSYIAATLTS